MGYSLIEAFQDSAMPEHICEQGDSVLSLSKQYRVPVDRIWNDPHNSALRNAGREPAILAPGDHIYIPDLQIKEVPAATEERHRFRCTGQSAALNVRFLRNDEPRADEPYILTVDGQNMQGWLDSDGWLRVRVPADAREAVVRLGEGGRQERFVIGIGHLDPVDETRGVQQRLENLGFPCGEETDARELGPRTRSALQAFQRKCGLEETGQIDEATKGRLREAHGT